MQTAFLSSLKAAVSGILLLFAVFAGGHAAPAPVASAPLGAQISAVADFRSSLAAGISSSATTMQLVSFASGSDSLVVGEIYGFKIGGQEYVIGTASSNNTIINMTRGLSRRTGTTTVAAYAVQWGRGTAVEQTDAPILLDISNKITGKAGFDGVVRYDSSVSSSTVSTVGTNLVDVDLLNYTAFNAAGAVNASTVVKGLTEIATQTEVASSTSTGGTGAVVVIPASAATSTFNAATAGLRVVTTQNNGKIDNNFINTSTLLSSSTNIGSTYAFNIGKSISVITSSAASTTFTIPNGVQKVMIQAVGGGGGGGGVSAGTGAGSGGGAGGYSLKMLDVSGTTTIDIKVGQGGPGVTAGTGQTGSSTIVFIQGTAIVAGGGMGASSGNSAQGGLGGSSSGGDLNVSGGSGTNGITDRSGSTVINGAGGNGAASFFGGGGVGGIGTQSPSAAAGNASAVYGGGGGGAASGHDGASGAGSAVQGGAGMDGAVIITW